MPKTTKLTITLSTPEILALTWAVDDLMSGSNGVSYEKHLSSACAALQEALRRDRPKARRRITHE